MAGQAGRGRGKTERQTEQGHGDRASGQSIEALINLLAPCPPLLSDREETRAGR